MMGTTDIGQRRPRPVAAAGALLVWAIAVAPASCGGKLDPEGQILLRVDTDAPLPHAPGVTPDRQALTPLFDRLRIDVYPPGQDEPCGGCSREFAAYHESFQAGASIGVLPAPTSGYRARIRLYRESLMVDGQPSDRCSLDTTIALPAVPAEGIVQGGVLLRTDDVGQPIGTPTDPVAWVPGRPPSSLVATWSGATPKPCVGEPREDEVCIPGGAFWMGNPSVLGGEDAVDEPAPRLVVLSPFFLDRTEVTVGAFRSTGLATLDPQGVSIDPLPWSGEPTVQGSAASCRYRSAEDSAADEQPLNCISYDKARAFCRSKGSDLPTEAQLEYAAGGLKSDLYVWGTDYPSCDDSVYGRGGLRLESVVCRTFGVSSGPLPPGSGQRDLLRIGDRSVVDLAGNVAELALDTWNRQKEACWLPTFLHDPICQRPSGEDQTPRTIRGGSWASAASSLRAAFRRGQKDEIDKTHLGPHVGFRCARPATM